MLLQNPQLAYALLQAQVVMKIVDPVIAQVGVWNHKKFNKNSILLTTFPSQPFFESNAQDIHEDGPVVTSNQRTIFMTSNSRTV